MASEMNRDEAGPVPFLMSLLFMHVIFVLGLLDCRRE